MPVKALEGHLMKESVKFDIKHNTTYSVSKNRFDKYKSKQNNVEW
jgi:hypothetical protein